MKQKQPEGLRDRLAKEAAEAEVVEKAAEESEALRPACAAGWQRCIGFLVLYFFKKKNI